MENENDVNLDSSPEEVIENDSEVEKTPDESAPKADRTVPYDRFKEVNDELARIKKQPVKVVNKALDIGDYIDISASLEGLDQREKEYLAQQHKLSGKSLNDIRSSEDFGFWQDSYRTKVEKEKLTLKPNSAQFESDRPRSLTEKLRGVSLIERKNFFKIKMEKDKPEF